jgi:hypothetical protein
MQTPPQIKQFWIEWAKQQYSDKFVELAKQMLAPAVQGAIENQVKASNVDKVLAHIAGLSQKDIAGPMLRSIETAKQNIEILTALRANEETLTLRNQNIQPMGGLEAAWTPMIEEQFKNFMAENLTKAFNSFADRAGAVLGSYYQSVISNLVNGFKGRSDELEQILLSNDGNLPLHLLTGEAPDPEEARRRRLLEYQVAFDKLRELDRQLEPLLK